MPTITIDESGCRACTLCVDVCPVDVLEMDASGDLAKVKAEDDCIGCTSCQFICPSRCIEVSDVPKQRPFFRIEQNTALVRKMLQKQPAADALGEDDFSEAIADVTVRLHALSDAATETMGRGHKAAGRKAGMLAAEHMPELYEGKNLDEVLDRMRTRFAGCFEFDSNVGAEGKEVDLTFGHCALAGVVKAQGEEVGKARLCVLFHEYWAGLMGMFAKNRYAVYSDGDVCSFKLEAR